MYRSTLNFRLAPGEYADSLKKTRTWGKGKGKGEGEGEGEEKDPLNRQFLRMLLKRERKKILCVPHIAPFFFFIARARVPCM